MRKTAINKSPSVASGGDGKHAHRANVDTFLVFTRRFNSQSRTITTRPRLRTSDNLRKNVPPSRWTVPPCNKQPSKSFSPLVPIARRLGRDLTDYTTRHGFTPSPLYSPKRTNVDNRRTTNGFTDGSKTREHRSRLGAARHTGRVAKLRPAKVECGPTARYIHISNVRHTAEPRKISSHCRLPTTKSIHGEREVQNGHVKRYSAAFTKRRVHVEAGHTRRFSAYSSPGTVKRLHAFTHPRPRLPGTCDDFRQLCCSPCVHKSNGCGGCTSASPRLPSCGILGRHSWLGDVVSKSMGFHGNMCENPPKTRIPYSMEKMSAFSCSDHRALGLDARFADDDDPIAPREESTISYPIKEFLKTTNSHGKEGGVDTRYHSTHGERDSSHRSVGSSSSGRPTRTLADKVIFGRSTAIPTRSGRHPRDNPEPRQLGRSILLLRKVRSHTTRRRLRPSMGGKYDRLPQSTATGCRRFLFRTTSRTVKDSPPNRRIPHSNRYVDGSRPHSSVGVSRTMELFASDAVNVSHQSVRQAHSTDERQHGNGQCDKPERSLSQSTLTDRSDGIPAMAPEHGHAGNREVDTRENEHTCGLRLATCTNRSESMDASSTSVSQNRPDLGAAHNRLVCNTVQCSTTPILLLDVGPPGLRNGCIHDTMASPEFLVQPPLDPYPRHTTENAIGERDFDTSRASMAQPTLVSNAPLAPNRLSHSTQPHAHHIRLPTPPRTEIRPILATDGGLETFRRPHKDLGFSTEVLADVEGGWRDLSKLNQVDSDFRTWKNQRGLDSLERDSYPVALEYLRDLHIQGKSFSTIRATKSALSSLLGENPRYGHRRLGELWITRMLMKSYQEANLATPRYERFWQPAIIHHYILNETPPLHTWSVQLTTKIAAYLLKESIAGRSSDLTRMDRRTIRASAENDKFSMVSIIKPKETGHQQSKVRQRRMYINYSIDDPRTNWRAVLEHYDGLAQVVAWRTASRGLIDDRSVLLTFGGTVPGRAPSVDSITRWVAEVLWLAGIPETFTPHSVRGAVVTAKIRKDLQDELTGIFASTTTRKKFYDRASEADFCLADALPLREQRRNKKWIFRRKQNKSLQTILDNAEEDPETSAESTVEE